MLGTQGGSLPIRVRIRAGVNVFVWELSLFSESNFHKLVPFRKNVAFCVKDWTILSTST